MWRNSLLVRLVVWSFVLAIPGGAAAGPVSDPAAAGGVRMRVVRPGQSRPVLLGGVLSAATTRSPEAAARAYLATRPEPVVGVDVDRLAVDRATPLARGAVVRFHQTFKGLEVVGGTIAVRLDAEGRARWILADPSTIPADLVTVPALDSQAAIDAVLRGPAWHQGRTALDPRQAQLIVYAPPRAAARLAWRVTVPLHFKTAETLRVYVDAWTGATLQVENLVKRAKQANVYQDNPVKNPDTIQVTLPLPDGATTLVNADVEGTNCIDNGNCMLLDTPYGQFNVHFCDMIPAATADGSGDFLYTRPAADTEPEDEFSEVQMFYHANRAYEAFRGWGFANLNAQPLKSVVNVRIPPLDLSSMCTGPTSTGPLNPFDNAAFMAAGTLYGFPPEDMMVFGQGTDVDFAYDGDVVYHEFTHAVVMTLSPLGSLTPDAYGIDSTTGGMHEGYADFFSCAITGDPDMSEYVGAALTGGPMRSADNGTHCPEDIVGETHEDGLMWVGSLWDVRQALQAEGVAEAEIDSAVLAAISALGAVDTFDTAQVATVAEITTSIGASAGTAAQAAFTARGVDGCNQRVIDTALTTGTKAMLFAYGTDYIEAANGVPGVVQFRLDLPSDSTAITVKVGASGSGGMGSVTGGGDPDVRLIVKPGDEPILWNWAEASPTHDAIAEGTVALTGTNGAGEGTVSGAFPAGPVHVQLINAGATWVLGGVRFEATAGSIEPDAGPVEADAAPTTPDAGTTGGDDEGGGDCGCRTGGSAPAGHGLLVLLGLLALALVRPRRTR